jgi:hypothetical protein
LIPLHLIKGNLLFYAINLAITFRLPSTHSRDLLEKFILETIVEFELPIVDSSLFSIKDIYESSIFTGMKKMQLSVPMVEKVH